MTKVMPPELSPALADVLEPALPGISAEIVQSIAEAVPEYVRPLRGAFGRGVRTGVSQALHRFVAMLRTPEGVDPELTEVYVALGREELRAGRTLDALQAAYRVGARVAWRRMAELARAAGFGTETLTALADAIFAYIDELSAESIEGFARAQSELAGEHGVRRQELVEALLAPMPATDEVARLAREARWELPSTAAALACAPDDAARLARRLGSEVLPAQIDGLGCIVVPDADAPARHDAVAVAAGDRSAALGPDGPLHALARSWRLARRVLGLSGDGLTTADARLGDLIVAEAADAVNRVVASRLAVLADLTPAARTRTIATALAYLQHRGSAPAMARALHVHPQTARYRIARIRSLLGEQLDDPALGFELEAALRHLARDGVGSPVSGSR